MKFSVSNQSAVQSRHLVIKKTQSVMKLVIFNTERFVEV